MKRKIVLPFLAVVFALAGAFASSPLVQQKGWYKNAFEQIVEGTITTPSNTDIQPCTLSGTSLCMVGSKVAYDTPANAEAQGTTGQLKYY